MDILDTLLGLFATYGYWVVFFGVMLENAGLPVPGETILLAAGFFSTYGHFSLPVVMLVAAVGAVIGDNIGFAVGRHYGRDFFDRFGRFLFLSPKRLAKIDDFFHRHGNKTILIARFVTGLRVFAALFAGASKMPWRTFFLYNVTGAMIWAVVIAELGHLFGHSWPLLEKWVGRTGMLLALAAIVVAIVLWRVHVHRNYGKGTPDDSFSG